MAEFPDGRRWWALAVGLCGALGLVVIAALRGDPSAEPSVAMDQPVEQAESHPHVGGSRPGDSVGANALTNPEPDSGVEVRTPGSRAEVDAGHIQMATLPGDGPAMAALGEVTFRITPPPQEPLDGGVIHVLRSEGDGAQPVDLSVQGNVHEEALAIGPYVATLEDAAGRFGPLVAFEVSDEASFVDLVAPEPFSARVVALDRESGDALEGARVVFTRTDLLDAGFPFAELVESSGSDGSAVFGDLSTGTWAITGELFDYASASAEVELPGRWADQLDDSNEISIGKLKLSPITRVAFQLVDVPADENAAGFRIAHTHEGDPVGFDERGRAVLELGRFYEPLYVKLWHPDGQESVRYLDGGLPGDDEAHEISIGGGQELEVDLQIRPEILSNIPAESAAVQVSFRDENGDAVLHVIETDGPGTFGFNGLRTEVATVSLTVLEDGLPVAWCAENVRLVPDKRNTCTLSVVVVPLKLKFVDAAGEPVAGFHSEVRRVPDTTTWIAGGACGADGVVTVPRASAGQYSVRGANEDYSVVLLDLPIDLSTPEPEIRVVLDPVTPTYVECQVEGRPRAGALFSMAGVDDPTSFGDDVTDESGCTVPYGLVDKSRALVRLESAELWAPERIVQVLPGRNVVHAFETGWVEGRSDQLKRLASLEFGASLADWQRAKLIDIEWTGKDRFRARVPVGDYALETIGGELLPYQVRVGATVKLP